MSEYLEQSIEALRKIYGYDKITPNQVRHKQPVTLVNCSEIQDSAGTPEKTDKIIADLIKKAGGALPFKDRQQERTLAFLDSQLDTPKAVEALQLLVKEKEPKASPPPVLLEDSLTDDELLMQLRNTLNNVNAVAAKPKGEALPTVRGRAALSQLSGTNWETCELGSISVYRPRNQGTAAALLNEMGKILGTEGEHSPFTKDEHGKLTGLITTALTQSTLNELSIRDEKLRQAARASL